MTRQQNSLTAHGLKSVGAYGENLKLGTEVDGGLKAAEGRFLYLTLAKENIAFMLASYAQNHPDVIRALAQELGEHRKPGPGRSSDFALHRRLSEAVTAALEGEEN